MHNWFECKVSYEKTLENGMQKKVTEPYLVDALSFTEAEARIIEEIRPFISGEFTVTDIKRARLSELFFNENGDRFYKIKVYFITLDEKTSMEKKTAANMLAQASTLKEAIAVLEEGMKGTLADYTIASVAETEIMDVYPWSEDDTERVKIKFKADSLEKSLSKKELSNDEQLEMAKEWVISKAKTDHTKLQVIQTQTIIRSKAHYNPEEYMAATMEMSREEKDIGMKWWYLGCGAILIEKSKRNQEI